jgi:hypothetical protein
MVQPIGTGQPRNVDPYYCQSIQGVLVYILAYQVGVEEQWLAEELNDFLFGCNLATTASLEFALEESFDEENVSYIRSVVERLSKKEYRDAFVCTLKVRWVPLTARSHRKPRQGTNLFADLGTNVDGVSFFARTYITITIRARAKKQDGRCESALTLSNGYH